MMLVTRIQIHCDRKDCEEHYPEEGAVDGALFTATDVRIVANQHGWTRVRRSLDFCPAHSTTNRKLAVRIEDSE